MAELVKVACHVMNGLNIRLFREGRDPVSGAPATVPDGAGVRLNGPSSAMSGAGNTSPEGLAPGITEVDRDWIELWMKQNAANPLVSMKQVVVLDEETKDPNPTR